MYLIQLLLNSMFDTVGRDGNAPDRLCYSLLWMKSSGVLKIKSLGENWERWFVFAWNNDAVLFMVLKSVEATTQNDSSNAVEAVSRNILKDTTWAVLLWAQLWADRLGLCLPMYSRNLWQHRGFKYQQIW